MKLQVWGALALLLGSTSISHAAAITPEQLASRYQSDGYSRVEVQFRGDRAEVEAIRDGVKIEVLYDLLSGNVLRRETERVDGDDDTRPGVFVREDRDDDFDDDDDRDDRWNDDEDDDWDDRDDNRDDEYNDDDDDDRDDDYDDDDHGDDDDDDNDDDDDDDEDDDDDDGDDD